MAFLSLKAKVVISFLTSVLAGFVAGQRDDGSQRIRRRVATTVAGLVGLVVGFTLAGRLETDSVHGSSEVVDAEDQTRRGRESRF